MKRIVLLVFFICLPISLFAEPELEFSQTYEAERGRVWLGFQDVYSNADASITLCGSVMIGYTVVDKAPIVLHTDEYGEEDWRTVIDDYYKGNFRSIVQLDDGSWATAGDFFREYTDGIAAVIGEDGDPVWHRQYDDVGLESIIELKNGNLAVSGYGTDSAVIMCLDVENGDILWRADFDEEDIVDFFRMREYGGNILVVGDSRRNEYHSYTLNQMICLASFSQGNGDENWNQMYEVGELASVRGFDSDADGFLINGTYYDEGDDSRDWNFVTLKVDPDGELQWEKSHEPDHGDQSGWNDEWNDILYLDDDGSFFQMGESLEFDPVLTDLVAFNWCNSEGEKIWSASYPGWMLGDDLGRPSMHNLALTGDGDVLVCGIIGSPGEGYGFEGILIKFQRLDSGLHFDVLAPEDTSLVRNALVGDTLSFKAIARSMYDDDIRYTWLRNSQDTLATDSIRVTVDFPELGVDTISCIAYTADKSIRVRWLVNVTNMYIDRYRPTHLDTLVRRGSTLDFKLYPRCNTPEEIEYLWTVSLLFLDDEYISEEDHAEYRFLYSQNYDVEGFCSLGETTDWITWEVEVRSCIGGYLPRSPDLSYTQGEGAYFEVWPFNWGSDSISYAWAMDGEVLDSTNDYLSTIFADTGHFELKLTVTEGADIDSIVWNIQVTEPNSVGTEDAVGLPADYLLLDSYPNPFNQETTIMYGLPLPGEVTVNVYDLRGRLVKELFTGYKSAGWHKSVFNALDIPAGQYFVQYNHPAGSQAQKIVLLK
ncbi:T9SS type A sorting domain-containing protein [Calditrichota bacterium]